MTTALDTPAGKYLWHDNWIKIPDTASGRENGRTHGIVVSKTGKVYLYHQASPGVAVYSADGKFLNSWGDYPGAHGMSLVEENGTEYLWLTDERKCTVEKLTLDGKLVQSLARPSHPAYENGGYVPTWATVNPVDGDIWVADGYGKHLVHRYSAQGTYIATIDGTEGAGRFDCPHGLLFDPRKTTPELYIADRSPHRVQVYSGEGKFLRVFGADFLTSPDGFAFAGDFVVVPELKARVTLLDRNDNHLATLGDNEPISSAKGWPNETPVAPGKFNSPHGAGTDAAGNIYVVEWRVGGRVTKLEKIA